MNLIMLLLKWLLTESECILSDKPEFVVGIQVKLDCLVFYSNETYFAHFNNRTLFKVNSQLIGYEQSQFFLLSSSTVE